MGFNAKGRFGGKKDFKSFGNKGGRGFGGRPGGKAFLHDATCGDCNKPCQVPFKPYPGKTVLCSDCFGKNDDRGGRSRPSAGNHERPRFSAPHNLSTNPIEQLKGHFAQLNQKLDAILRALTTSEEIEDMDDMMDESEDEAVAFEPETKPKKAKKALAKK